jgi:hypothetical protein
LRLGGLEAIVMGQFGKDGCAEFGAPNRGTHRESRSAFLLDFYVCIDTKFSNGRFPPDLPMLFSGVPEFIGLHDCPHPLQNVSHWSKCSP